MHVQLQAGNQFLWVHTSFNVRQTMKKQTKSSKMDESLGMKRGKESSKSQSMKSRRDESKGASKKHPDEAQDKKLIKSMMKKSGCK